MIRQSYAVKDKSFGAQPGRLWPKTEKQSKEVQKVPERNFKKTKVTDLLDKVQNDLIRINKNFEAQKEKSSRTSDLLQTFKRMQANADRAEASDGDDRLNQTHETSETIRKVRAALSQLNSRQEFD